MTAVLTFYPNEVVVIRVIRHEFDTYLQRTSKEERKKGQSVPPPAPVGGAQ